MKRCRNCKTDISDQEAAASYVELRKFAVEVIPATRYVSPQHWSATNGPACKKCLAEIKRR